MTPDTGYIRASDGVGEAGKATVTVTRSIGATTLVVDSVANYNDKVIVTTGILNTETDTLTPESVTVFWGHITGGNIIIDGFAPGYVDIGNAVGDVVLIKPTTLWANVIADLFEVSHNSDGSLKAGIVTGTELAAAAVDPTKMTADAKKQSLDIDGSTTIVFSTAATQPTAQSGKTIIWFDEI